MILGGHLNTLPCVKIIFKLTNLCFYYELIKNMMSKGRIYRELRNFRDLFKI